MTGAVVWMVEIKQRQAPELAFALSEVGHIVNGGGHLVNRGASCQRGRYTGLPVSGSTAPPAATQALFAGEKYHRNLSLNKQWYKKILLLRF